MTANPGGGDYRPEEPAPDRVVFAHRLAESSLDVDPRTALRQAIAFSSADWGAARDLAWIYGIVLGWDGDPDWNDDDDADTAMTEIAVKYGWDAEKVAHLRALNAAFNAQDGTDATETPARTPGGSGTAEARTEAHGAAEALRDMADRTIAEAVCCDEYERFKAGAPRPKFPHEICYWSAAHAEALRARADEIDAERESATDPSMTNLEAELVALRAQVARQANLLRAINDCHLDPARAILQADKIAGEAILRAEAAEAAHKNCAPTEGRAELGYCGECGGVRLGQAEAHSMRCSKYSGRSVF